MPRKYSVKGVVKWETKVKTNKQSNIDDFQQNRHEFHHFARLYKESAKALA